jgi:RimJ/RimL family protein N-acetyltransferase
MERVITSRLEESILIRHLDAADAGPYQALKLAVMRDAPLAFAQTYEEAAKRSLNDVANRLARADETAGGTWGAFSAKAELVGAASLERGSQERNGHRAVVWGLFVAPCWQGRGIGRRILEAVIAHARSLEGLEELGIIVMAESHVARRLYESLGFNVYASDPRAWRVNGNYIADLYMSLLLHEGARGEASAST